MFSINKKNELTWYKVLLFLHCLSRTLDVSGNKLGKPESVPGWVGKLQMLKTLVMVGCELTEIPEGLSLVEHFCVYVKKAVRR